MDKSSFSIFRILDQKSYFHQNNILFMGYGKNGYQIRIRRIEKIRMDTLSAHIDHTKPSKHNLMYFPITLSSPLKMKPSWP